MKDGKGRASSPMSRRQWMPDLIGTTLALVAALAVPGLALLTWVGLPRLRPRLQGAFGRMGSGLRQDGWWPLALVCAVALGTLSMAHPFPPDDLARDLVAWASNFDYRHMFWASPLIPPYNQYIGFDHLAGWVYHLLPRGWRSLPFQLLPLAGLMAVVALTTQRFFKDRPNSWLAMACAVLLTLMMPGVVSRCLQGRPEVDFAVWALSALLLPDWLWLTVGILMAPLYWLAPAYACGCLLLKGSWGRKLIVGGAYAVVSLTIWLILSHGHYLSGFVALTDAGKLRIGSVGEDETIWTLLAGTGFGVWGICAWCARRGFRIQADLPLWLTLACFLVPTMIRYTDCVSPLMVLLAMKAWARSERLSNPDDHSRPGFMSSTILRLGFVWACLFILPAAFSGPPPPDAGFLARVRAGDRILTPFNASLYRSIYAAVPKGAVLAPAMELGFTNPEIQKMAFGLSQDRIDCQALHEHHVQWVVEKSLRGTLPGCLQLDSMDGDLRAWRVLPKQNARP